MNTARRLEQYKSEYKTLCEGVGTDPVAEENAILSVGREYLPAAAVSVLDKAPLSDDQAIEYYQFLIEQTTTAQAEHEAAL